MTPPKFDLLYYKNIVDRCFREFVREYQEFFVKNSAGVYVFAASYDKNRLADIFRKLIDETIREYAVRFDVLNPEYLVVIGGCSPKDNLLLCYKSARFPAKLDRLVNSDENVKYLLNEKDVDVDMPAFNEVFDLVFDELFRAEGRFWKLVADYPNLIVMRHNRLCCYSMFKVLKYILGSPNCVNVYAERLKDERQCLVSVNDLIVRHSNKARLNKSPTFIKTVDEVSRFVSDMITRTTAA